MVETFEGLFIIYIQRRMNLRFNIVLIYPSSINLDISIKEGTLTCKLFEKREPFPFLIVKLSHLQSNIPQNIFYSAIKGEFLKMSFSTLYLRDFIPKAIELLEHMKQQVSKHGVTDASLGKIILVHPENFPKYFLRKFTLRLVL